ncbi:hypothetical protein AQUCO_01700255v1 [Aquilegia coerulea]|uniref:Leucine-rich repeat-containing N-terminal plant-type domain-containing protein n=1 Tax=Aquilegia coerulea TaxID=218851 RepID=A0A2G5DLZ3_AQUCA|nr:hypothetical protein AQUCO_01700255v1 [Aquilegia coerulea]
MAFLKSIILVFIVFCFIETIQLGWNVDGARLNCPQNERNALLSFKQGLIDQTNRLSSWVGQDCCKWKGVSCNNFTGHVVKLDLRNPFPFDLDRLDDSLSGSDKTYSEACLVAVGEVNSSLLELKHLNYLDLSWNNFSGIAIPKFFGLFHELTYLNLSTALFGGNVPHHLGNLSTLHSLDLGTQNIFLFIYYDNLPSLVVNTLHWTSSLVSLKHLVMSGIDLSNIPLDSFQAVALFSSLLELRFFNCSLENIPLFHSTLKNFTSLHILDLSYNKFQGPIPSAIRNMTSLKVLKLSSNRFNNSSVLDELKNLYKLEVLDLSSNEFAGKMFERFPNFSSPSLGDNLETLILSTNRLKGYLPNWLYQLKSSLKFLDLSDNSFEGRIPVSLGKLSKSETLILRENQLSDEIPLSFGTLSNLKTLNLGQNQLSGEIPVSLGKLSNLKTLDLGQNQLSGEIPMSFGTLSNLKTLDLGQNQLSGEIPMSFGTLSNLKTLDLGQNQLSGEIPMSFGTLSNLKNLVLSYNQFNGTIPTSLGQLSHLTYLLLDANNFHGVVSELHFARLSKLKWLALSDISLSIKIRSSWMYGKVPNFISPNIVYLYLSSNRFEGSFPQFPSSLRYLDLSDNIISGSIPTDIGYRLPNLELLRLSNNSINGTIPSSLCKMLSLSYLDFSKNHLLGVLPNCLGDLQRVVVIDLTSNNLSGTIQRSFCHQSKYLTSLHLSKNNFQGEFLSGLQNCTSLSILDVSDNKFSGEIPTWIGQNLYSLRIIKLSSNKYNGSLSPKLCHLNQLQVLDFAGNNLSGNIPHCFGNFNRMLFNQTDFSDFTYKDGYYQDKLSQVIKGRELEYTKNLRFVTNLDLSNNIFIGQIPEQLTNLSGLNSLNLSRNHLTGSIPKKIGQMRSLESLDLSNNHLSGTIPQSISALTLVSYLNLSNNNLSGPFPSGNQLQTLNDTSIYDGNNELCGLPLEKKCIPPQTPTYVDRKSKGEDKRDGDGFITIWFYLGMVSGCVVGFWGFCGVLLFKKSRRYAYFQFVDSIIIGDRLVYTAARRKVRPRSN